jgi:hypothetical protein
MKRFTWVSIVLVALAVSAHAQTVERITISNPGIYRSETEKIEDAPNSVRGVFRTVRNPQLIEQTKRIPGLLGTHFGVNFRVAGQPDGASVTIRFVTRFPAPGLRDPKTGKTILTSENDRQFRIGEFAYRGFTFDESWEIVPGVWALEFWFEGKLLAAQKFEIVKADTPAQSERGVDAPADTPSR